MALEAGFHNQKGKVIWELPGEAERVLMALPEDQRKRIVDALGGNLEIFCTAVLSAFGNPAKVGVLNAVLQELHDLNAKD